ncbi:MAG: glycosyltransferase family 39 protein, partial [Candidatus Dormibacteria bacterium]
MSTVSAPPRLRSGWIISGGSLRNLTRVDLRTFNWRRISIVALLALTAALYVWDLGASGWANSFYSAAVQAGSHSWKAFLFGSFDSSNFITVDKPPASLWVMDISARIFGVNSWSILVPQALEGVATVGLLYATIRRRFGHSAGLIAGLALALTPVSALIFRYNNPDALLVLLLVASAFALDRALDQGRTRWIVICGALIGFGFLTKMLQAFAVVPAFAAVYALAAPVSLRKRAMQLLAGGLSMVVSAGWWVALVVLWPAGSRPYIGGSQDNSILNLIFGYNGFGRITGNETGSVGGGGAAGSMWGPTGIARMFNDSFGSDASWLMLAALVALAAVVWLRWRAPRTDAQRASALMWGGWLIVTALLFSFAQGIIHPYYTVALAPAIGALVGMGAVTLWRNRHRMPARIVLAAGVFVAAAWSAVLLGRAPDWLPWLRYAVIAGGIVAAAGIIAAGHLRRAGTVAVISLALAASVAGSVAYTVDTALTPHQGAI